MDTTAIVTEDSRGIGREVAIMFCEKGVNVIVCSRKPRENDDSIKVIRLIHSCAIGVKCNVRISSHVDELVKKAIRNFGN